MKRTYVLAIPVVLLAVYLFTFQTTGGGSIGQSFCQVTATTSGTYNSVLGVNYLSNMRMSFSEGACYPIPTCLPSLDIFPTQIPYTITASPGGQKASGTVNVPQLTVNYNFQTTSTFCLSVGTYQFTWNSPIQVNLPSQGQSFTQSFTVS
ncbi:MAG: hypothetical protein KGI38_11815 [Thaumarchaeota archaeon]|nr:hypothetical protein [Nitrososphaerota archaeon]